MRNGNDCVATELFRIQDVIGCRQLVNVCFGPDGKALLLTLSGKLDYRIVDKIGASFPKLFASHGNEFRIHYQSGDKWSSVDLPSTSENYHSIQPLPGNRWLVVRCRAKSASDLNAHIFDSNGRHTLSFHVGDGIQDVQVADDGIIWFSFFDEGVFGRVETGRTGLIALDDSGRLHFDFEDAADSVGCISDCYAMNVASSSDTWVYYYTEFPIVHLHNQRVVECWKEVPVAGARAIAVGEEFVVLVGSYDDRDSLFRLKLNDMQVKVVGVTDAHGNRIDECRAFGRGSQLFLASEHAVYSVDISTL